MQSVETRQFLDCFLFSELFPEQFFRRFLHLFTAFIKFVIQQLMLRGRSLWSDALIRLIQSTALVS